MLAVVFLVVVSTLALLGYLPLFLLAVYVLMSLLTLGFYFFDKNAARAGGWRTPESTLHLLAVLCGWPGAMFAQQRLRHKTQKQSFRVIFWLTVVVNCTGLVVYLWVV